MWVHPLIPDFTDIVINIIESPHVYYIYIQLLILNWEITWDLGEGKGIGGGERAGERT